MANDYLISFTVLLGMSTVITVRGDYDTINEHLRDCSGVIQRCASVFVSDSIQTGDECRSAQNYINCAKRGCPIVATYPQLLDHEIQESLTARNVQCDLGSNGANTIERDLDTCQNVINLCANSFRQDFNRTWDGCGSARKYFYCVKRDCPLAADYPNLMEYEVLQSLDDQGFLCDFNSDGTHDASTHVMASSAVIILVALVTIAFTQTFFMEA